MSKRHSYFIFSAVLLLGMFISCSKNDGYYKDSGRVNTVYNGSSLDYLKEKGYQFDSLVKVIHLAGMDDLIDNGNHTFFAPADSSIALSIKYINGQLKATGKDTISDLAQINPAVWRSALSMYLFDSVRKVSDFPQLDFEAMPSFHGQAYTCYGGGRIMNIGAIYEDAAGVKYAGYRHLVLSYIPSYSAPLVAWENAYVASSDIVTRNGVIHALRYIAPPIIIDIPEDGGIVVVPLTTVYFGFDAYRFYLDVLDKGIMPR